MHVSIFSIKETLFDEEAVSLTCPTISGEITILENHRALITVLKKGELTVTNTRGEEIKIPTENGVIEVHNNDVRVIL